MQRLHRFGLAVLCIFLLSACATSYQPKAHQGGYSESEISKDIYHVEFGGNGLTDHLTAQSYWLYRCAELALEKGYTGFEITTNVPIFQSAEEESVALRKIWRPNAIYVPNIYGNIRMTKGNVTPYPPKSFDAATLKMH